jgi:uncharacterized membrane protein
MTTKQMTTKQMTSKQMTTKQDDHQAGSMTTKSHDDHAALNVASTRRPTEERTMADHQDGQSTAAWTAVVILLLASFLICLAVLIKSWPVAVVGMILVVVGAAAGKVLAMAGFGQTKPGKPSTGTEAR